MRRSPISYALKGASNCSEFLILKLDAVTLRLNLELVAKLSWQGARGWPNIPSAHIGSMHAHLAKGSAISSN
jgi:hypothetical protein